MRIPLALFLCCSLACAAEWQQRSRFRPWRVGATHPSAWQGAGVRAFANLGTAVEVQQRAWPRLLRRMIPWQSIQRLRREKQTDWGLARSFGSVRVGAARPAKVDVLEADWSHALCQWTSGAGTKLRIWASRTTPALLVHSDAEALGFLSGKDAPQPHGFAREVDGTVAVGSAMQTDELSLPAGAWLLVWFGTVGTSSRFSTYLPAPYPADCPLLFLFENAPTLSFRQGLVAEFAPDQVGHVVIVPIFGDRYLIARRLAKDSLQPYRVSWNRVMPAQLRPFACPTVPGTEGWGAGLPDAVAATCRWWAERLHEFPAAASETYRYDAGSDTIEITERFRMVRVAPGGRPFAPIPPTLALAREEGFPVQFTGPVVSTSVLTAHGPVAGVDGAREYTWRIAGISRYVRADRTPGKGTAPRELAAELEREVAKVLDAGELAPWYPVLDDDGAGYMGYYDRGFRGHFVFGNPAATITYLAEAYPLLGPATQKRLLAYLKALRHKHPPEVMGFLPLGQGASRERCRATPPQVVARLNKNFVAANFYVPLKLPPEKNLYHLARYYELTGDVAELKERWEDVLGVAHAWLAGLDWGTMGTFRRPVRWQGRAGVGGVSDVNDLFAGLAGAVRLAGMAGDAGAETMFRGVFARVAALRVALGKYPRYLYRNELLRLPSKRPDWMMDLLAGSWHGYLYTTRWTRPGDDVQQVWQMDQFGVHYCETRQRCWPGIVAFLEPVPELGLLVRDHLRPEAQALMRRVNESMPAWWTVYCPCVQTWETSFQPPEDAHQLFMLQAWVLDEKPEHLTWRRDVPWLARGDLFYVHKLAEAIRAYRR